MKKLKNTESAQLCPGMQIPPAYHCRSSNNLFHKEASLSLDAPSSESVRD